MSTPEIGSSNKQTDTSYGVTGDSPNHSPSDPSCNPLCPKDFDDIVDPLCPKDSSFPTIIELVHKPIPHFPDRFKNKDQGHIDKIETHSFKSKSAFLCFMLFSICLLMLDF